MQQPATNDVMGELQRTAIVGFKDLSRLSAVAMKHASNEQIMRSLLDGYLASKDVQLAPHVRSRIDATPKDPFGYKHQYGTQKSVPTLAHTQVKAAPTRKWWEED